MSALPGTALIIGGGFSGMTAALELSKLGIAVEILEMDPAWRTDGAGISLHGASLRVFQKIGIYDEFLKHGGVANGFDIFHPATDETITTLPTPVVGNVEFGGAGIMRPVLAQLLRNRLREAGIPARLGLSFKTLEQDADGVTVTFSDGDTARYDLVVGADGVGSSLRSLFFPHAPQPQYTGQGGWRAVVNWPPELARPGMWINGKLKVGLNVVSATQGYVFITEPRPTSEFLDPSTFVDHLAGMLREFPSPVLNRFADSLGPHSQVLYRPFCQLLVSQPWSAGRVVLIGDAVHATTPHLAAGACIAMEDAVVLAEELGKARDVPSALAAYEERRWERCRMVVENSNRLREIETTRGDFKEHESLMRHSMAALAEAI